MTDRAIRNTFNNMPFIPYNIIEYLALDSSANNIWKILKYPTYDCLKKPNLTLDEKMALLCQNQGRQQNYNIFLNQLIEDMAMQEKTILKLFKVETGFESNTGGLFGVGSYRFDILYGGKIGTIEYNKTPCNRGDVLEMELLKSLNGVDINGGSGYLEYNPMLSRNCGSNLNLGDHSTFTGTSMIMAIRLVTLNDTEC